MMRNQGKNFQRACAIFLVLLAVGALSGGCAAKKNKEMSRTQGEFAHLSNERLYKEALHALRTKHHLRARNMLEALLARPMDPRWTPLAQLRLADSHFRQGGLEGWTEASYQYRKFLRQFPRHTEAAYAQYQIGMCHFRQILHPQRDPEATERAMVEFEKVIKLYPESVHRASAERRIELCRRKLAEREFYIGKFYYNQMEYESALERFEAASEKYAPFSNEPEFLYYYGETLWALGRREEGRLLLERVVREAPYAPYTKEAQARLQGAPNRQGFWKKVLPPYL